MFDQKKVVAVAFVAGLFMDILDTTVVNVALPSLARDFDVTTSGIEWVVTGYLLSLALWIPASGWLGDRFGTKRIFLFALVVFTLASALCGLAWSLPSLVAFRVLQGVGGGMLTPVGTAMLYRAYPPAERARASAVLSTVTVLAPAVGPVLGGFLVEKASWRWIFFINLPVGVFAVAFAALFLTEHREPRAGRFDLPGFVLSGLGLALILYGLAEGPQKGWGSGIVIASLAAGVVAVVLLVVVELRQPEPMLDLRLLADRSFRTPNLVSFAAFSGLIGVLFLLPQFLQGPRGLSPIESGLATFPQALGVMMLSRFVGTRFYPVIGPRRLAAAGMLGVAVITCGFLLVDLGTSAWWIRSLMFARGLAIACVFIPVQAAAFARIEPARSGRASSLFQVQRQTAAAVGVAVLATVLASRLTANTPAGATPGQLAQAYTSAFHESIAVAAVLAFLGVLAALFLRDADAAPTMRPRAAAHRRGGGAEVR